MKTIGVVAVAVFRESVRDRVFYNLVFFALLLVGASILIGQLTAGQDVKIIKDLGLAATSLFGVFIAVFVGISLVSKEVDRRSVYPLLAKPIRRAEFILGKYAGVLLTLLVNTVVMTVALYAVLFFLSRGVPPNVQRAWDAPALDPAMLKAIALIYLDIAVVTAVALFFSSYSSPMLSTIFTLGVYVAGQFSGDLKHFNDIVDAPAAAVVAKVAYVMLPDFSKFDVKLAVVHGIPVSGVYMASAALYALVYIAALLFGATTIFSRRDFK
jgi:ABC-type transport system involved in multi-copper enzyme maturation permease subunit